MDFQSIALPLSYRAICAIREVYSSFLHCKGKIKIWISKHLFVLTISHRPEESADPACTSLDRPDHKML